MSDLKTNLEEILQEKETKIIPANIKKDVQIFDVVGTYEGEGASDLNNLDLLVPDMIWMNSISINDSPDIGLVENIFNELSTTESGNYSKTMQLVSTGFSETLSQSLILFSIERSNNNRYFNLTLQDVLSEETYKSIMYISLDLLDQGIKINGISDELLTSVTETGWYIISSTGDSLTKADTTYISELEQGFSDKGYITQVNYGRKYGSILSALNSFVTINLSEKLNDFGSTDAIASDILKDKKAFANGSFITGTYEPGDDVSNYINTEPTETSITLMKLITKVPEINTSSVTNMYQMFQDCSSLTTIPQLDTSNVTNMSNMFKNCSSLTIIPQLDTSSVTNMYQMFQNCSSLTTIPQLDTSSVTSMNNMFQNCSKLAIIPLLDTSHVTGLTSFLRGCDALVSIPQLDTISVTMMSYMLADCPNLTTVPSLNMANTTNLSNMVQNCNSLSDDSLNNILASLLTTTKISSSNKTLKYIGLSETQATTCTTLSNWAACEEAGWTTGY